MYVADTVDFQNRSVTANGINEVLDSGWGYVCALLIDWL